MSKYVACRELQDTSGHDAEPALSFPRPLSNVEAWIASPTKRGPTQCLRLHSHWFKTFCIPSSMPASCAGISENPSRTLLVCLPRNVKTQEFTVFWDAKKKNRMLDVAGCSRMLQDVATATATTKFSSCSSCSLDLGRCLPMSLQEHAGSEPSAETFRCENESFSDPQRIPNSKPSYLRTG